ncbi:MAG: hypothetical protein GY937_20735 [bacterium]|nr:hypothetical protein [bacterium]
MSDELDELKRAELFDLAASEGVSTEEIPGGGAYQTDALRHRIRAHRANTQRTAWLAEQVRWPAWIAAVAATVAACFSALNFFCAPGSPS